MTTETLERAEIRERLEPLAREYIEAETVRLSHAREHRFPRPHDAEAAERMRLLRCSREASRGLIKALEDLGYEMLPGLERAWGIWLVGGEALVVIAPPDHRTESGLSPPLGVWFGPVRGLDGSVYFYLADGAPREFRGTA